MRRTALVFVLLASALALVAAGCGGEENKTATPDTTQGSLPTQTTTTETTSTSGEEQKGDATAGKAVFTGSAGCTGCHTLSDAGATGTVGPNLDQAKPNYDRVVQRVTNGLGAMPSFKGQLTDQQIQDVAAYVSSVAGK